MSATFEFAAVAGGTSRACVGVDPTVEVFEGWSELDGDPPFGEMILSVSGFERPADVPISVARAVKRAYFEALRRLGVDDGEDAEGNG